MASPETLERLAQACRHAGYAATVTDHASVRAAGTSGEVLAVLLNGQIEGARCALDADNTFVLVDDVLAPTPDLVPEFACQLWLLRGQAPRAARLVRQVARGLTPEAVLGGDDLDARAAVEEVQRMLQLERHP